MTFRIKLTVLNKFPLCLFADIEVYAIEAGTSKRFRCPYCKKSVSKLPRHLSSQHKAEREVRQLETTTDRRMRKLLIIKLRNLGCHIHNTEVVKSGKGKLMVAYRPKVKATASNYLPCEYCYGYYARRALWKHAKRCKLNSQHKPATGKSAIQAGRALMPAPTGISDRLHKILSVLQKDEISKAVYSDKLILQLGQQLCLAHGHNETLHRYLRCKLREVARLLLQLRLLQPSYAERDLEQFINGPNFDNVLRAARMASGFDESDNRYKTPSLALKLGHSVKLCAKILKGNALMAGNQDRLRECDAFIQLHELRWLSEVSCNAHKTLTEMKKNKIDLLPLTEDIKKLSSYLSEQSASATTILKQDETNAVAYFDLANTLLGKVIIFNRRRQGEVSKMSLEDYFGARSHKSTLESHAMLSEFEKKLSNSLHRIEITGKKGRTVPVLLTKEMDKQIELLIQCRPNYVAEGNRYVFGKDESHIRGSDVLRKYSELCGAVAPERLRSTKLRKHIATTAQVLNLKEHEMDILANFMGHDIRVHREFYRLPEQTLQLTKVSKLLLAMERGEVMSQTGKSLWDMEVDLIDDLSAGMCKQFMHFSNCHPYSL